MSTETLGHNAIDERSNGLFGVYVHWPFCAAKCPYCDFNSHVHRGPFDEAGYVAAYAAELAHFAQKVPGRSVQSVFFGGGTPSLMPPEAVAAVIARAKSLFSPDAEIEITLEANPTDAEAGRYTVTAELAGQSGAGWLTGWGTASGGGRK